jgi:hypothetical protein
VKKFHLVVESVIRPSVHIAASAVKDSLRFKIKG